MFVFWRIFVRNGCLEVFVFSGAIETDIGIDMGVESKRRRTTSQSCFKNEFSENVFCLPDASLEAKVLNNRRSQNKLFEKLCVLRQLYLDEV